MAGSCEGYCTTCQKTTRKYCSRCVLNTDVNSNPLPLTFYCSADCQKADYASHKTICSARQQLFRGAQLLKQAFLTFREITYDSDLYDVTHFGDQVHSYVPIYYYAEAKGPLYPFRHDLVPNQADKEALLAYRSCAQAQSRLFPLTSKVLEGIVSIDSPPSEIEFSTEESAIKVHNHVIGSDFSPRPPHHQVLVVTLKNGETYVIDLAGAQYRQYRAAVPWDMFSECIVEVKKRKEFGYEAKQDPLHIALLLNGANAAKGSETRYDTRVYAIQAGIADALIKGVKQWESFAGKTVTEMLRTKACIFEKDVQKLHEWLKLHMVVALKSGTAEKMAISQVLSTGVPSKTDAAREEHQGNRSASEGQTIHQARGVSGGNTRDLDDMVHEPFGRHLIALGIETDKFLR